jgi:hypothetical protein
MDKEHFKIPRKGTIIVPQCSFSFFVAIAKEAYERFGIMLNSPRMHVDFVRSFDLMVMRIYLGK